MPFTKSVPVQNYAPIPPQAIGDNTQRRLDQEVRNIRNTLDALTAAVREIQDYLEAQP